MNTMRPSVRPDALHGRTHRKRDMSPGPGTVEQQPPRGSFIRLGIASVVLIVVALVVATFFVLQPKRDRQAGTVVGFSAPPTVERLHVVILRGGATGCRPTGGCNAANYAEVLSSKEGWITTVLAQGGTGYVNGADADPPGDFGSRLPDVYKAAPDLVIVEGSVGDQYYAASEIHDAAATVFADLKSHLPNALVVAVGPAWANTPPAKIVAVEGAVKEAAATDKVPFIDPIQQGWFSGASASLMAPDQQSPTDAGHARMAAMMADDLTPLLHQPNSRAPATTQASP
jgi:hypothetical protein